MKKWTKRAVVALLAGSLFCTSSAWAEEQSSLCFDLDQIVVTATKTEKKIKDVPASVSVITAQQLKAANVKTLDDALQYIPGVYIKGQRGMKATKISIRGLSQNRVLVLMDGVPLNNGYTGGAQWGNIPLNNIERVEVIKGPFSALYGSSAMGGVINIITKEGKQPQTSLTVGSGEQGNRIYQVNHNGVAGQLEYYLDYDQRDTDGYVINPTKPQEGKFDKDSTKYNLKMIYHLNDKDKISMVRGKVDTSYGYSGTNTDRGQRTTETTSFNYQKQINNDKKINLHWGEINFSDYWTITGTNYNPNPAKTQEGEINFNWQINDKNLLTVGATDKVDKCNGKTYKLSNPAVITYDNLLEQSGGKTRNSSVYMQNEMQLDEKSTLYLGGRYDHWKFSSGYNNTGSLKDKEENNFSPKAALVYKSDEKTSWHVSAGKSFVSPTIFNLARLWLYSPKYKDPNTGQQVNFSGRLLPNADLKPEKCKSYEIGVDRQYDEKNNAKISFFHNDVDDLIYQATNFVDWNTRVEEVQWKNAGKARIKGVEVEMTHEFTPILSAFFNYTYNDAKIVESSANPKIVGKQVTTVPKETIGLGVNYNKEKVTANILGRYVSRTYEKDDNSEVLSGYGSFQPHFVVDTKLSYHYNKNTDLSLSVDNLFDKKYYQESLAPGRTVTVELTQKF